jgi:pSer/pThr/pTyr-binding forkhead associated (FHA) protein
MAAFLIVQRGEDIGRRFDLDTTQLTVGRGSDNDMVLNDPMVSRYHAVVKRQGNGHLVIDLGSSNPVVINDQVCEPGEPRVLQHRDVVFIGKTVFSFQNRGGGAVQTPGRQQTPMASTQFVAPSAEFDSPTPPPPSRQAGNSIPEARVTPATTKPEPATSPAIPAMPASPSLAESDDSNDERTVVAGLARPAEPFATPPPPPAAGMRSFEDDDSTRPTPGLPPLGIGTIPPPPPPPAFAPPKPPQLGGSGDDDDGDMQTQIVPRRS